MLSWPTRAARPKSEKPTMFARRDMAAVAGGVEERDEGVRPVEALAGAPPRPTAASPSEAA